MVIFLDWSSQKQSLPVHPAVAQHTLPTKALLSVLLFLGGNLNHLRPPVMRWMCSKAALTSAPSGPAPRPSQCPAGEQEQQVHPQPREQRWPQLPRQIWCLPQAQHAHSRYQPHDCTPNLSKDKARASPHQSMAQAEFTLWHISRGLTEWHHQVLAVQDQPQLRKMDVVHPIGILTPVISLCLKKASTTDQGGVRGEATEITPN